MKIRLTKNSILVMIGLTLAGVILFYLFWSLQKLETVHTITKYRQESCGVLGRDDFDDGKIDKSYFRKMGIPFFALWKADEDVQLSVQGGRLWLQVKGRTGYKGLITRVHDETDVEFVVTMDTKSTGKGPPHECIAHLCGSSDNSPDMWVEIMARDRGDRISFELNHSVPGYCFEKGSVPSVFMKQRRDDEQGYTVKLDRLSSDGRVRCSVLLDGKWVSLGPPIELPCRTIKTEIKLRGGDVDQTTTGWYDNFRLYPHPQTHYIQVSVQDLPERFLGPDGTVYTSDDFIIKLFTGDGKICVGETDLRAYGSGMIPLRNADWDTYPASCLFRAYLGDTQIGHDMPVVAEGLQGLYPDDKWTFTYR